VIPPGDWDRLPSRIETTTRLLLSILEARGARATFFALGWVAARHQDLVREIRDRGHEVGVHGYLHRSVADMTDEEFRADLRRARDAVEGATGERVNGHRAARWSLGGVPGGGRLGRASGVVTRALDVLIAEGVEYDSSLVPIVSIGDPSWPRDPYRIDRPAGSIQELPPLVGRFLGVRLLFGSGWALRRVPNRVLLGEVARRNRLGIPVVLDLHPWEIDPDPPRIDLPLKYRIAHYGGLHRFRAKLEDLLDHLTCVPVREYLARSQ